MLSNYYQALIEDMLAWHPEIEAVVVVGTDGNPVAHARMGTVEEAVIAGIISAIFSTSDTLSGDMGHGHVRHLYFRFRGSITIVYSLEPGILLVVVFLPGETNPDIVFSPERLLDRSPR